MKLLKKYKCGIIGLGRIGCGFDDNTKKTSINTHAGAYFNSKKASLEALCDIDEVKLQKYGEKYQISRTYNDYNKMFQNENLDCVSICTLTDSHLEIVKSATKNDIKGIFLEKPISNSLQNAAKIIELCRKNNVKLQIDHQRRFDPIYHKIWKFIKEKKLGAIQGSSINYVAGISNTGSHFFDILRYLIDEFKWIRGEFSNNLSNNPADPNIDGVIKFRNGTFCNINSFDLKHYRIFELDILGSKGRFSIDLTESTVRYYQVGNKGKGVSYRGLIEKPFVAKKSKDAIVLGVENLLYSIENDVNPLSRGEEGYSSVEAIIAMIKSAKNSGKIIQLPLKNNSDKISSR